MAQLTKEEFYSNYASGYNLGTSTKMREAYRQYQLKGTLPGGAAVAEPTGTTTPTTPTTTPTYTGLTPEQIAYAEENHPGVSIGMTPGYNPNAPGTWEDHLKLLAAGGFSTEGLVEPTVAPTESGLPVTSVFGEGAAAGISAPVLTAAPTYEVSPELQEKMDLYGDKLTDWVTSGGYGLDPETQAQMIQIQTDTLKAREQESIRVMKNNMERRGIFNSGYVQAAENQITSNTSVAIAGAIADVQIKSALMKMASFEKGMGAMASFLGFLSEQSQLAYAPEFATWQAEQLKTMQVWQGKLDIYKMELNQAYQTQNIELQARLTSELNEQQQGFNIELAEMEIEANNNIAMSQGIGGIFGTILGFIFGK